MRRAKAGQSSASIALAKPFARLLLQFGEQGWLGSEYLAVTLRIGQNWDPLAGMRVGGGTGWTVGCVLVCCLTCPTSGPMAVMPKDHCISGKEGN